MLIHLKDENFHDLISKGSHLVDFYADWCGPCKMLAPILEEIDSIDIIKVNTDEHPTLAQEYQVMSIPTLIYFKDGKLLFKQIGFQTKETIENSISNIK